MSFNPSLNDNTKRFQYICISERLLLTIWHILSKGYYNEIRSLVLYLEHLYRLSVKESILYGLLTSPLDGNSVAEYFHLGCEFYPDEQRTVILYWKTGALAERHTNCHFLKVRSFSCCATKVKI